MCVHPSRCDCEHVGNDLCLKGHVLADFAWHAVPFSIFVTHVISVRRPVLCIEHGMLFKRLNSSQICVFVHVFAILTFITLSPAVEAMHYSGRRPVHRGSPNTARGPAFMNTPVGVTVETTVSTAVSTPDAEIRSATPDHAEDILSGTMDGTKTISVMRVASFASPARDLTSSDASRDVTRGAAADSLAASHSSTLIVQEGRDVSQREREKLLQSQRLLQNDKGFAVEISPKSACLAPFGEVSTSYCHEWIRNSYPIPLENTF